MLTEADIEERREFEEDHGGRSEDSWVEKPHASIDNKKFLCIVNGKGRCYEARRAVRGAYRSGGQVNFCLSCC